MCPFAAPSVLVLDDATGQRDPAEDARDHAGLVTASEVAPDRRRIAGRMDPVLPVEAAGDELAADRPVRVVDDGR